MSHKIKLILIVFLTILLFGLIYVIRTSEPPSEFHFEEKPPLCLPYISFEKINNTLVVSNITLGECSVSDLIWKNFELHVPDDTSGSATLPKGTIKEGDKITDCTGYFSLIWKPCNISRDGWIWNFEEE